jgi:protease secretion system membrane fusion protein
MSPISAATLAVTPKASDPGGEDASRLRQAADTRGIIRKGFGVVVLALGGFMAWAAWAPLDEGVPSAAVVALDTKRKTVQHPTGGIVNEVLVREGEAVKEGQVLMRLDGAFSRANFEEIRQRYLALSATQSRLLAEQAGASQARFTDEVLQAAQLDSEVAQVVDNQRRLLGARQASLSADLQAMREAVAGLRAQLSLSRASQAQRQQELELILQELGSIQGLVEDGYVPRNRALALQREAAALRAAIAEMRSGQAQALGQIAELTQRQNSRQAEYSKEVETQLAQVASQVKADAARFVALKDDLQRIDIRSPADGQVVGLAVQTVGAVVQAGQQLMDIVPRDQALLLEAKIPPHLIDRVHAGLHADIRFSAFSHAPQLVVQGQVVSVSGDLLSDPANPQFSYFLARVEVTPEGMAALGDRQMQPGMPAEVVIKTGERSMLTYLLHPLTKRIASSMKEE